MIEIRIVKIIVIQKKLTLKNFYGDTKLYELSKRENFSF